MQTLRQPINLFILLFPLVRVVYVSFGGLQLMLKSDPLKVQKFKLDEKLFLLLRKMTK